MAPITLTLPFPPSVNRIWRSIGGRTILSAIGRKYRQAVIQATQQQRSPQLGSARLEVLMEVFQPDLRKRDLDNLPKAVLDGLTHSHVYKDDSQIDCLAIIRRSVDRKDPRIVVTIRTTDCSHESPKEAA